MLNKDSTVSEFCYESCAPGHWAGMSRPLLPLFEVAGVSLCEHQELLLLTDDEEEEVEVFFQDQCEEPGEGGGSFKWACCELNVLSKTRGTT